MSEKGESNITKHKIIQSYGKTKNFGSLEHNLQYCLALPDNSYSAEGLILKTEKRFTEGMGFQKVALWHSEQESIKPTDQISWNARGCTNPSNIEWQSHGSNQRLLAFFTDGEIDAYEVRNMSEQGTFISHLPMIAGIFDPKCLNGQSVGELNVSVHMRFFAQMTDALIFVSNSSVVFIVAAKGEFRKQINAFNRKKREKGKPVVDLPEDVNIPLISPEGEANFPCYEEEEFFHLVKQLPIRIQPPVVGNNIRVVWDGESKLFDIVVFNNCCDAATIKLLCQKLDDDSWIKIITECIVRNHSNDFRECINNMQMLLKAEQETLPTTKIDVTPILQSMRNKTGNVQELREQLVQALESNVRNDKKIRESKKKFLAKCKPYTSKLESILANLSRIEKSGARLSALKMEYNIGNRAERAETMREKNILEIYENVNPQGPELEDDIMMVEGQVAVTMNIPANQEELAKTVGLLTDFCLNNPLLAYYCESNFCSGLVNLEIVPKLAYSTNPFSRKKQGTFVYLPAISLKYKENWETVMYLVRMSLYTGKCIDPTTVAMGLIGIILGTLDNKDWAKEGRNENKALWYLVETLFTELEIFPEHFFLEVQNKPNKVSLRDAFLLAINEESVTVTRDKDLSTVGILTRLCHRFGVDKTLFSPDFNLEEKLRTTIQVRVHGEIICQRRRYLSQLDGYSYLHDDEIIRRLYSKLRTDRKQRIIPVAGTERQVVNIPLDKRACELLEKLPSLSLAGITLVLHGALDVKSDDKPSVAIDKYRETAAGQLSMDQNHVTSLNWEDIDQATKGSLSWAVDAKKVNKIPPFFYDGKATHFGPSVLWFYLPGGEAQSLTDGYVYDASHAKFDELTDFTEYLREQRRKFLRKYLNHGKDGSYGNKCISVPLHRHLIETLYQIKTSSPFFLPSDEFFLKETLLNILEDGRGCIYSPCLEADIKALIPSLKECLKSTGRNLSEYWSGPERLGKRRDLKMKVEIELNGKTPTEYTKVVKSGKLTPQKAIEVIY